MTRRRAKKSISTSFGSDGFLLNHLNPSALGSQEVATRAVQHDATTARNQSMLRAANSDRGRVFCSRTHLSQVRGCGLPLPPARPAMGRAEQLKSTASDQKKVHRGRGRLGPRPGSPGPGGGGLGPPGGGVPVAIRIAHAGQAQLHSLQKTVECDRKRRCATHFVADKKFLRKREISGGRNWVEKDGPNKTPFIYALVRGRASVWTPSCLGQTAWR